MNYLIYELFSGVGFCNQLFSFETAIYLSSITNRKLILLVRNPLAHCGRASWTFGKFVTFLNKEYINHLPHGIDIIYGKLECSKYLNNVDTYQHVLNSKSKFSNIVFVDKELNTQNNSKDIDNFSYGKTNFVLDVDKFNKYKHIYINNSNASRMFTNFYTTEKNYILMSNIAITLSKLNDPIFINHYNTLKKVIGNTYDIGIHFRFGDSHKPLEFINENNKIISDNILPKINNKNILVMVDNYKNSFINKLKIVSNNVIFLDDFVVKTLNIKDTDDNKIMLFLLCQRLLVECPQFFGTVRSTVSVYTQYLRHINNLSSNYYIKRNIETKNINEYTWNVNKIYGASISWSYFFPDNIQIKYINNPETYLYLKYVKQINIQKGTSKKIISFVLYNINMDSSNKRSNRNFFKGIFVNYHRAKIIYPGWIIRIYLPYNEPTKNIKIIESFKDIEIVLVDTNICLRTLRFLPYDDENVDIWISRDLDSIVNWREKVAVDDWINNYKNKEMHIMHDNRQHHWPILAGMFGIKNSFHDDCFIDNYMKLEIENHNLYDLDTKVAQKLFLKESNYIQHYKAGKKLQHSKSFPKHTKIIGDIVGDIVNMNKLYSEMNLEIKYPNLINNMSNKLEEEITSFQKIWKGGFRTGYSKKRNQKGIEEYISKNMQGGHCLEIGCGGGQWSKHISNLNVFDKITCIDVLSAEHNKFWEYVGDEKREIIQYINVDDFSLKDVANNSLDYVFSYDVFCHISYAGQKEYLKNLYKKCKKNCKIFIMYADPKKYLSNEPEHKNHVKLYIPNKGKDCNTDQDLINLAIKDMDGKHITGRWYWVGIDNFINLCNEYNYKIISKDLNIDKTNPITLFTK